jgi:hypothetical protein
METKGSLPHSIETSTGSCPELEEASPQPQSLVVYDLL